jgi:hypothetical protein
MIAAEDGWAVARLSRAGVEPLFARGSSQAVHTTLERNPSKRNKSSAQGQTGMAKSPCPRQDVCDYG